MRRRTRLGLLLLCGLLGSPVAWAGQKYNPFTGKPDYVLTVTTEDGTVADTAGLPLHVPNGSLTNNTTYFSLTNIGAEVDLIPASGNSFEIYADIANRLWIVNRTSGVILLGFLADGTLFSPNLNCNGANTFVTSRGGNLICSSVAGSAGGTVTSITAGNQLTGGTITGSGTIAVSTTPTFTSLTLSATTPQLQLTPASGNAHEIYDSNSELFFTNTTTGQVLLAFDAAGAPFLPGLTCTGANTVVNITSTGRLLCGTGGGTGTVTSITAGTGLSGGTITTSGTIALNATTTTCTNQFVSAISSTAVGTCTTATLASAQFANQGTTTQVLHGNAAGNPSFTSVGINDVSGSTGTGNFVFATAPTLTTLTLSTGTPQLQLTPSSGSAHELYDFNSELFLSDTTNARTLLAFDAAGRPFLPTLDCSSKTGGGLLTATSQGLLQCLNQPVGTVTSITAGTGLSGGIITGTGTISLTTPVTAANGGTGNTTNTLNGVLYGNAGSAILATTQGASNTVLTANAGAPVFSATPTIQSLTLSATTPQVQLTPSSGNAHEIYDSNSVLYITNTTTGQVLLAFDAAGAPFLPGLTCTGNNTAVNITSTGRLLCVANAAGTGTVTSITAGTGLTGGVITTSGTINLSTALLAAGHTDTVAAGPTRGDLIVANSTPKWARFAVGGTNTLLTSNGTDPSWSSTPTVTTLTDTSDLDITPAAGNTYELSANASVLYLTDKTDSNLLFFYDKDDRFFLPQITGCDNASLKILLNGRVTCGTINLATTQQVTGTLPVANGGTGDATLTTNGVVYGNGTSAASITAQGAANTVLTANAGAPSFSNTPTIGSLTLSLANPQLQLSPTSGNQYEWSATGSILSLADTTNTLPLLQFDGADRMFWPQLNCSGKINGGRVTTTATGLVICDDATPQPTRLWLPTGTYPSVVGGGQTNATTNQMRCARFNVPTGITLTEMVFDVASTGGTCGVGVYPDDSGGAVLVNGGGKDCTTSGAKTTTGLSVTLQANVNYRLCHCSSSSTTSIRSLTSSSGNAVTNVLNNTFGVSEGIASNVCSVGVLPSTTGTISPAIMTPVIVIVSKE